MAAGRRKAVAHYADFVRIDDDSFRVTCRDSGAVARLWPRYAWGGAHAIWEKEPPRDSECHSVDHVRAATPSTEEER